MVKFTKGKKHQLMQVERGGGEASGELSSGQVVEIFGEILCEIFGEILWGDICVIFVCITHVVNPHIL